MHGKATGIYFVGELRFHSHWYTRSTVGLVENKAHVRNDGLNVGISI